METGTQDCKSSCPVWGGFCWKSPVHWVLALAVLPFTFKGVAMIAGWLNQVLGSIGN